MTFALVSMTHGARIAWLEIAGSWLLFAAVALAPLPFGSDQPITIAFWCIVLGGCLAIVVPVRSLGAGQLALAALAGVVVAAYALVLHEQTGRAPLVTGCDPASHLAPSSGRT